MFNQTKIYNFIICTFTLARIRTYEQILLQIEQKMFKRNKI